GATIIPDIENLLSPITQDASQLAHRFLDRLLHRHPVSFVPCRCERWLGEHSAGGLNAPLIICPLAGWQRSVDRFPQSLRCSPQARRRLRSGLRRGKSCDRLECVGDAPPVPRFLEQSQAFGKAPTRFSVISLGPSDIPQADERPG